MSLRTSSFMRRMVRCAVGAALLGAFAAPVMAQAADYPNRPLTLVVPFGPGSVTDLLGRLTAQKLGEALGQPVVVQNKAGAGGNIGAGEVAAAPADGYTLLVGPTSTNAVAPSLYKDLKWNPLRDFTPVTNIATVANVLVVNPDVPAKTVQELIELLPQKEYAYASTGTGGSMHLSGELFKSVTNTDILHVPYKGGGAALADLLPGRVQLMFCNVPLCLNQIEAGKLRALAVTSADRSSLLPDVPSMKEAGLDYEVTGWFGLFVPAGTDPAIVEKLNKATRDMLDDPEVKKQLSALGAEPAGGPSDEFADFVKAEHDKWAKVVEDAGITVE